MKAELQKTLAVVNDGIRASISGTFSRNILKLLAAHLCLTVRPSVTIDLTDCGDTSEEENSDESEDVGEYLTPPSLPSLPHRNYR